MQRIETTVRIGSDGVLHLPVGIADAGKEVRIIIEPVEAPITQEEWARRIDEMAGSWVGDFERPEQGEYEQRDPLE